jgi:hypothetical protein
MATMQLLQITMPFKGPLYFQRPSAATTAIHMFAMVRAILDQKTILTAGNNNHFFSRPRSLIDGSIH